MSDILLITCEILATLSIAGIAISNFFDYNKVTSRELQDLSRQVHNLYNIQLLDRKRIDILEKMLVDQLKHPSEVNVE